VLRGDATDQPSSSSFYDDQDNESSNFETFPTLENTSLDNDAFDTIINRIDKAFDKKRNEALSKRTDLRPQIIVSRKEVYLPDTYESQSDNIILNGMIMLAKLLGFAVKIIPYGERKIRELSPRQWKIATGIGFACKDIDAKINIKQKDDYYELGRTYARSQQIYGYFNTDRKLGIGALKRNQRFFGNNPGEMEGSKNSQVPVAFLAKEVDSLFIEQEWAKELAYILNNLLRRSSELLKKEILDDAIADNIIPFSELMRLYGSRKIVARPSVGRQPAIYIERMPKYPRQNSMLLAEENKLIRDLADDLFKSIEVLSGVEYIDYIKESGFAQLRERIETSSSRRAEFLSKFAAMTTRRLAEWRKLHDSKSKRKRDVTPDDVKSLLRRRERPPSRLAEEILFLDPTCKGLLKGFASRNDRTGELDKNQTLRNLLKHIKENNPYDNVSNQKTDPFPKRQEEVLANKEYKEDQIDLAFQVAFKAYSEEDTIKILKGIQRMNLTNLRSADIPKLANYFDILVKSKKWEKYSGAAANAAVKEYLTNREDFLFDEEEILPIFKED
jgi:hypothetical protein